MTRWLLTDLHIHSTLGDGEVPLEEIARIYGGKVLIQSVPQKGSPFLILLPIGENVEIEEVERELTNM